MNSLSIRFLFIAAVITSVAAWEYYTVTSYSDAQCTKPTGGYFVIVYEVTCSSITTYQDCKDAGGIFLKGSCGTTDPMSPLPKDVAIDMTWTTSATCEPTDFDGPYYSAFVGTPGSCFMGPNAQVYKFDQCQNGKMTMRGYLDVAKCKASGVEIDGDTGDDGVCRVSQITSSLKIYCPISSTPTAQTAPTTSASPQSATPSATTPAKASNGIITASISLTMLIGTAVALLA